MELNPGEGSKSDWLRNMLGEILAGNTDRGKRVVGKGYYNYYHFNYYQNQWDEE